MNPFCSKIQAEQLSFVRPSLVEQSSSFSFCSTKRFQPSPTKRVQWSITKQLSVVHSVIVKQISIVQLVTTEHNLNRGLKTQHNHSKVVVDVMRRRAELMVVEVLTSRATSNSGVFSVVVVVDVMGGRAELGGSGGASVDDGRERGKPTSGRIREILNLCG